MGGVSIKPSQLLVVDTTNDVVDGNVNSIGDLQSSKGADGFISLREAIIATNNTAGADTISLAAGTYTLTITGVLEDLAATGDLDILGDLSIIGADAATTIIDGNGIDRVFHLGGFVVSLEAVTIANGDATVGGAGGATDVGGGLLDAKTTQLNLDRVIFTGNHGRDGGAAQFNGTVAGSDLVFDSNTAGTFGGAFRNQGNVTFERVTFSGNSADEGGAIENRGNSSSLTLTNATFSGNSATAGKGGALFNSSIATLQNVTIAGNTAATSGGGIWNKTGDTVKLSNSLVADHLVGGSTPEDLEGAFVSSGNNLVETPGTATGLTGTDIIGIDPLLSPLADNGGFTQTMALQSGSVATDAGTAAGAPTEDQRGISRDANPDIGAFELVTNNPVLDLDTDGSSGSTGSDFSTTFTDGGGPVAAVDADATLTDANDTDLQSLTVTITDRQDGVDEILAADTSGTSIVANFSAGVLTLSGTDTVEKYQQVLRTITYDNGQNPATGASRTITFVASDGSSTSNIGTTNLSVIAAPNTAPTANAGGPYVISEGDSLNLDASASSDPDTDPLTYAWDLDNDLVYGEAGEPTTVSPTVSWATLQSFGITGEGVFTIGLQVDDGNGGTDTTTANLNVYAEQLINTTTANVQQKSDVATDATGNYVVVWQSDGQDGDGTGVFAQRYDSAGATVGSEFPVNTTTVGNQSDPRVAMDDAGNFVVTWSSEGQNGDSASETNIYARVYGASGTALTGELLVNETTLDNQTTPAIAMDAPTGVFMITWASFDPVAGDWNIFARRFGALGIPLTSEFMVNTTTVGDQVDPDVSVDVIAEFAVVWTGYGQDGDLTTEANIYGQYYRANGTAFGSENLINTTTGGHQHSAAIALEDDGDYTIVWVRTATEQAFTANRLPTAAVATIGWASFLSPARPLEIRRSLTFLLSRRAIS